MHALAANYGAAKQSAKFKNVACSKPSPGSYKLNVVASYQNDESVTFSFVLRNH
jgi:hypothetical protein